MVKINILGHKELKVSPLAFGTAFTHFGLMDNPTQEDLKDCLPLEGETVKDCEGRDYEISKRSVDASGNIVIDLLYQED